MESLKTALKNLRDSHGYKWIMAAFILLLIGSTLNQIVVKLNSGMPVVGLNSPIGKWIPFTLQTKAPMFADTLPMGNVTYSMGDLFIFSCLLVYLTGVILWYIERRKAFAQE